MVESQRWSRKIACDDHAGRERYLEFFITEKGYVGVFAPAGEVAVIKPPQIAEFRRAFDEASVEAMSRRITS